MSLGDMKEMSAEDAVTLAKILAREDETRMRRLRRPMKKGQVQAMIDLGGF